MFWNHSIFRGRKSTKNPVITEVSPSRFLEKARWEKIGMYGSGC